MTLLSYDAANRETVMPEGIDADQNNDRGEQRQ
jgi:hypothetical protein